MKVFIEFAKSLFQTILCAILGLILAVLILFICGNLTIVYPQINKDKYQEVKMMRESCYSDFESKFLETTEDGEINHNEFKELKSIYELCKKRNDLRNKL